MNLASTRDVDPRIRILSCDAVAPRRRPVNWPLVAGVVLMATAGVGTTLALRAGATAPPVAIAAAPATPEQPLVAHAFVDAGVFRPTRHIHKTMRAAVTANLSQAAKAAAINAPAPVRVTTPSVASAHAPSPPTAVSGSSSPTVPPATTVPPASTVTVPDQPQAKPVGPEQAPGAGDPVSPMD